jgi:hypothetical protein
VVPSEIATAAPATAAASPTSTSTSTRGMGMSADGLEQPNSFPGSSRRGVGLAAPMNAPEPERPPIAAPPPPAYEPPPPPPSPPEEPQREEPPPPPPPPVAPPPPVQEEEEAEEAPAEPAPTTAIAPGRGRFLAAPLRFMPGNNPQNPSIPPPAEPPADGE